MADVTIKVRQNGPYEVRGTVQLIDFEEKPVPGGEGKVYLCRCGRSAGKPFCDGTHKAIGWCETEAGPNLAE